MRGLTLSVELCFVLVTVLTLLRWLAAPDPLAVPHSESPVSPVGAKAESAHERVMTTLRDESAGEGTARRELSADGQRHSTAEGVSATDALTELQLALDLEFERREALALAQSYPTEVLVAFFAERTHIDVDWLHRNGLGPEWLPHLYARWAAGAGAEERSSAPGQLLLSRYTPRLDGGPYRAQRRFHPQDRTVFLHYSLPERYQPDAVLVRWVQEQSDDRGEDLGHPLQHFDRHHLTGDIHQRQEAWMRPSRGWTPGDYRVEIFSADGELQLLASQTYRVE